MRSKGKRNEASASVKVEQMVSDTAEMNGNTAASSQIEESSSSVPMMAYTMERHSVEFIKDFINTYRSFSCLWKMKSPEYCNRHKKADAFDKLIKVSRKYYPAADLRFVKHKIQNLRTVYKKELNKVEASKRSGARTVYTPRLWYFEMMEFTKDQEVTETAETAESIPSNEESIIEVKIPSTSCENSEASEMSVSAAEETEMCPTTVPDETSPMMNAVPHLSTERSRKRNREQMKKTIELLQRAKQLLANPPDEFEGIALNVAGKLRRMSECQRMYCEKLVTDLLMKGLLGELDEDTIIHNRRHVGPPPHPSMSNNSDCMYRYDLNHSTSSSSTNHPDYASY